MDSSDTISRVVASELPRTALVLLTDPSSILLDPHEVAAVAAVGLSDNQGASRSKLKLLHECSQALHCLRPKLKRAFTVAFQNGDIDAATAQRLIDRFELWSD